ncbi:tyrosine-protein phosphatase 99A isoform X2 [Hyalella azteca]|uniref:Tyrosine-protein phosphatase 99A isoform X2 n=1 Tax=Hyalella azteca TaxID=294128 RepID=A0A8B7PJ28_HYAAZ|nr:tyrosine-protein phosphatase 99A isoform X2 [Hyalella azteca]
MGQSKPSQESYCIITLREEPEGKPVFTSAHNTSSSSIELHWKPPPLNTIHGEFLGYKLTLQPRYDDVTNPPPPNVLRDTIEIEIKDPKRTSTVIQGLKTFTQYLVSLRVFNPTGAGPNATVAVMTDEGIPSPPLNLTVTRIEDTTVELSWLRPRHPNGEIRGYRIFYMRGNFTSVRTAHVHGDEPSKTFKLTEMEPLSHYKVWAKAFTPGHEGNSSEPVNVTTDASGPGAPFISNLTCQSETSLYLQWHRPGQVYGKVDLYYIHYKPEGSNEFEEVAVYSVNNRLEHNFLITNLTSNTFYEVKVRGGTYSRFYSENNLTYKGPSSAASKILLYPNCHEAPTSFFGGSPGSFIGLELRSGILAGAICAAFALCLILIAMLIWRRFFNGSYYYLDEPSKSAPLLLCTDWENDTGGDGAYGPVAVQDFAQHVQRLHADGDIGFSKEYEAIQAASTTESLSAEHSHHPDNKQKNRYLNIVAYDHTRVPLRPLPGQSKRSSVLEYVNANYIDGYDKARAYIGTQGPLPSTFDTFWRMVWEQRVSIIVMITNLVERGRESIKKQPKLASQCLEKKCDQYWPKEGTETYGLIQVRLVQEDVLATYTIRKFAIRHMKVKCTKSGSVERTILQYHYTNWPDHGTPDHPLPVLAFVRISAAANPDNAGPIIVHCSAGVGRTGTYIVLDAMLRQIKSKGKLNIYGFLKHIRLQRNFLVQTEEQYMFLHDALVEAIQCGNTCVPAGSISRYIASLQAAGGPEHTPWFLLHHQFKMATQFTPEEYNVISAVKPCNRHKNRTSHLLPMENARVHLTPKAAVDGSDYMNATWLMGYQRLKEFIITQHPVQQTILDFWQMVWDHNAQTIVLLNAVDEETGLYPQFWPNQHEDIDSENWKVRYLEERVHSGQATVEVAVQSLQDDYELPVRLVMAPGWPDTLPALATTLSLVTQLHEAHQNYQNGPLVVVDRTGGTESAMFCLLTTLKSQLEYEKCVDPFLYFKLYHNRRPGIWNSQDDLLFIYRAMESHIGSQCSLNASSSSSCDLAGLSDPVICPMPNMTVIPSSLPSLTVIPSTLPSVIPSSLPNSLSLQQPCDLIPTSVSGSGTDLTPPQTPLQTQANVISAAAANASHCLAAANTCLQDQSLQQMPQLYHQPIVQPLTSPVDLQNAALQQQMHQHQLHQQKLQQQVNPALISSPVSTLTRNRTMSPVPLSSPGMLNTCGNGVSPLTVLPPNGCPGNGFPRNNGLQAPMTGSDNGSHARVSPEGREDLPLTSDSVPLELAPLPPV